MFEELRAQEREEFKALLTYFLRERAAQVDRYRTATLWNTRRNARKWVLHYGRLIRKMRGAL